MLVTAASLAHCLQGLGSALSGLSTTICSTSGGETCRDGFLKLILAFLPRHDPTVRSRQSHPPLCSADRQDHSCVLRHPRHLWTLRSP